MFRSFLELFETLYENQFLEFFFNTFIFDLVGYKIDTTAKSQILEILTEEFNWIQVYQVRDNTVFQCQIFKVYQK
jgi:hypothetical protein